MGPMGIEWPGIGSIEGFGGAADGFGEAGGFGFGFADVAPDALADALVELTGASCMCVDAEDVGPVSTDVPIGSGVPEPCAATLSEPLVTGGRTT